MDTLFDYLPKQKIIEAFERSPGKELDGKFLSKNSSAALAANTFGFFWDEPERLPHLPVRADFDWPPGKVRVEQCVRFPWPGGRHPWLDVLIETRAHLIGIESKRFEPFGGKPQGEFSEKYWSHDWGEGMKPYTYLRDQLRDGHAQFEHFNATQLIKHAFGLRTQANKGGKSATLVYLYAEPEAWASDGRPISAEARQRHAAEIERFATLVSGAEVAFRSCTYKELLTAFRQSGDAELSKHADRIAQSFNP